MKKTLIVAGMMALMGSTAMADGIGVSMAKFDDNFLTVLRNGIQAQADAAGLSVDPGGHGLADELLDLLDVLDALLGGGGERLLDGRGGLGEVALLQQHRLPVGIDQHRAERVMPLRQRRAGHGVGLAQMVDCLREVHKRTPWIRLCRSTSVAPLRGKRRRRFGGGS